MQIVQTSITRKQFGKSSQYLIEISEYGSETFPYMYAVARNLADAETWLLHHCQKFGKDVVFSMPDNTLATFN
jgi:hypothetical protein